MNRSQLQKLSDERTNDAEALLHAGQWSGAYYLAGYAVENALKACIAKQTQLFDFPDKNFVVQSYTHDLERLIRLAGLELPHRQALSQSATFASHWVIVKDWNEESRYGRRSETEARELFTAITDSSDGVLPWIKQFW